MENFKNLNVIVYRINDGEDTETYEKEVNEYDLEKAVDENCEDLKEFLGFTNEVYADGFIHSGSRCISKKCEYEVSCDDSDIEIYIHNVENAHIQIFFTMINEDDEEIDLAIEFDTKFNY